jgi:hypothetical protein
MFSIADRNYPIPTGTAIRFLRSNWLRPSLGGEMASRKPQAPCLLRVTSYGTFACATVDVAPDHAHIRIPQGWGQAILGGEAMGAAPQRNRQAVVSPLRVVEVQDPTKSVPAVSKPGPLHFARIPTHAIGVAKERRTHPRACLSLALRLIRVGEVAEPVPVTLVTRNISSSGVYFLAPRKFEPGTAVELEVALVERPLGQGRVQMCTAAHIVRAEELDTPGWHGYAATFDDFALRHDDVVPLRYQAS